MHYIYIKDGSSRIDEFATFVDVITNTFHPLSTITRTDNGLQLIPGETVGVDSCPLVITHSQARPNKNTGLTHVTLPVPVELLLESLKICSHVFAAIAPLSSDIKDHEYIASLRYYGCLRGQNQIIALDTLLPVDVPTFGFLMVFGMVLVSPNTSTLVINTNTCSQPHNCDFISTDLTVRTIGPSDGSMIREILAPTVVGGLVISDSIIVAQEPEVIINFFGGIKGKVGLVEQTSRWTNIPHTINTNVEYRETETGVAISACSTVSYFSITFDCGPFFVDSPNAIDRFDYHTIIIPNKE